MHEVSILFKRIKLTVFIIFKGTLIFYFYFCHQVNPFLSKDNDVIIEKYNYLIKIIRKPNIPSSPSSS